MSNHMEAAVKAAAVKLHETWCGDDTPCGHPHGTDKHFATEIVTAALPHLSPYMLGEKADKLLDSLRQEGYKDGWNACFKKYGGNPDDQI